MTEEPRSFPEKVAERFDRIDAKLQSMKDWMHEIKGGLKVAYVFLAVILVLLGKALVG
mgnify:CR=1 FL=1